jgi:hypothetical protein
VANGKHCKTRIFQLQDGNKTIEGDIALKKYITSYYKSLFGKTRENNFQFDESLKEDIPQVTDLENEALIQPFMEEEIKGVIFQMEHNKAHGPDGFPTKFH